MSFAGIKRCIAVAFGVVCWGFLGCDEANSTLEYPDFSADEESSSSAVRYDPQIGDVAVDSAYADSVISKELGVCSESRDGEISRTSFCGSTCYVICDSLFWRYASQDERDVEGFPEDTLEGSILKGRLLSLGRVYVFENGIWRLMTFVEKNLGYCDSTLYDRIDSVRGSYYYCMNTETGTSEWAEIPPVQVDFTFLPDSAVEDSIILGARSERYFIYRKGGWRIATMENVIGFCYDDRYAETVNFLYGCFTCKDGIWEVATRDDILGECNEAREGSEGFFRPVDFVCKSGEWIPENLKSHEIDSSFYWDSSLDIEGRVSLKKSNRTSGYFFEYTDAMYAGSSIVNYPGSVRKNRYEIYLGPLVAELGKISATVEFGVEKREPFAGLGFNLWNGRAWSDSAEGVDVRKWGGLCFVYESDGPMTVSVVPEGGIVLGGGNFHKVRVPSSAKPQLVNLPFEAFKQDEGWGYPESIERVLASAASILFYMEGVSKEKKSYSVYAIGSLGECDQWAHNSEDSW